MTWIDSFVYFMTKRGSSGIIGISVDAGLESCCYELEGGVDTAAVIFFSCASCYVMLYFANSVIDVRGSLNSYVLC